MKDWAAWRVSGENSSLMKAMGMYDYERKNMDEKIDVRGLR